MKKPHHNKEEGIGNRDVAKFAKKTKYWCWGCDANLVGQGETCSVCGMKDEYKKRRIR